MKEFRVSEKYVAKKQGKIARSLYLHFAFFIIALFFIYTTFKARSILFFLFLFFAVYVLGNIAVLRKVHSSVQKSGHLKSYKLFEDRFVLVYSSGHEYTNTFDQYPGWVLKKSNKNIITRVTLIPRSAKKLIEVFRPEHAPAKKLYIEGIENFDDFITELSNGLPRLKSRVYVRVLRILMIPVYFLLFSGLINASDALLSGFMFPIAVILSFIALIVTVVLIDSKLKEKQYKEITGYR
ncbi:MAG TPA: hypothetical protein ENG95_01480 [Nitrospirae bacterium]|nr:hypothetical protein BMS3Abin10_00137 [bacterium BMS3Abin10]GBE39322.1 hypothetical protein BMS3Bbin08_01944 [bacterium BMS3Bbin08]HDH00810.1 hypothetical protein [Nitrospirota bacterium]HDH51758.1 hypothetical protein [Nitrospirota bacterium]HDK81421.1 hypothetical protein [Nitrospirota bacterium]